MSFGPGRVQRAILDAISTPEATATYAESWSTGLPPGPVGVSVETILTSLYGPEPTRAQRHSVWRAIRTLRRPDHDMTWRPEQVEMYEREACPDHGSVVTQVTPCQHCGKRSGYDSRKTIAVGRPCDAEELRRRRRMQSKRRR